jgi:hypothetical protein
MDILAKKSFCGNSWNSEAQKVSLFFFIDFIKWHKIEKAVL